MDEVENQQVAQELATPETSPQEMPKTTDDRQERNWREMRKRQDELLQKTKMQEELISQLLSQQKAQIQPQEIDELDKVPDDDYIPKGQVKKLVKKAEERAEKAAKEAVEKVLQEREKSQFMDRLKSRFSDFEEVVTPEALEIFEQQDPELAKTIADTKDPYTIGLQTYKYIKSMGLANHASGNRRSKEVEKKIEQNQKTVQSPQAFDKRPMAQTFQMTEAMKSELYKEMMQYGQLAGGVPNM